MKIYITIEGKSYKTANILNVSEATTKAKWTFGETSFIIHCMEPSPDLTVRTDDILGHIWLLGVVHVLG